MGGKIGLIAGGGSFPLLFAAEAQKAGREVYVVGLDGITPKEIERHAAAMSDVRIRCLGRYAPYPAIPTARAGLIRSSLKGAEANPEVAPRPCSMSLRVCRYRPALRSCPRKAARRGGPRLAPLDRHERRRCLVHPEAG